MKIQRWWKEEGPLSRGPKMRFGQPCSNPLKGWFGKWWIGASTPGKLVNWHSHGKSLCPGSVNPIGIVFFDGYVSLQECSSVWPIVFDIGSEQAWDKTWKTANSLACGLSILQESKPLTGIFENTQLGAFEQRFLVGRFSLYKVCLVKCWRRHFACARRLFVGILTMLVNIFFCVGGVGGSVLLWYCKLCFVVVIWDVGFHNLVYQYPEVQKTQPQLTTLAPTA